MTEPEKNVPHFNESIDQNKEIRGNSRRGGDAPPEVQQKIIDIIIEEARKLKFDNRDIAYYIAIAKRESGFNPDAASASSTASGIAQVIDKTGTTLGINDANRFDARSSIKAGLNYFVLLKNSLTRKYGKTTGEYEALIYYCYHYGEFSVNRKEVVNGQPQVKEPLPFSTIKGNAKYNDSQTVVDEATRIEKILNGTHGLQIQLTDVLGKAMAGRKVVVVQKVAKPVAKDAAPTAALAASSTPSTTPSTPVNSVPATPAPANIAPEKEPTQAVAAIQPMSAETASTALEIEWQLQAIEITTDADGHLPEIETESQQPFLVLVPRIDFKAYNKAVAKGEIPEEPVVHHVLPHNGEQTDLPAIKTDSLKDAAPIKNAVAKNSKPLPVKSVENPKDIYAAADASARAPLPAPSKSAEAHISLEDALNLLRNTSAFGDAVASTFVYIKQFVTRPKLPATPLNEAIPTVKAKARTQTIGSSLQNKDIKQTKIKDQTTTAEKPVQKLVEVDAEATWMKFALAEQTKHDDDEVKRKSGKPSDSSEWSALHTKRKNAEKALVNLNRDLKQETAKSEKKRDAAKLKALSEQIEEQQEIVKESDDRMREIEKIYNNEDIVKYLESTGLERDQARNDETAWCASYVNWCVKQAGFSGPKGAPAAESWKNWGIELKEPRYGAITVVTRAQGKYHVGFFTGITEKEQTVGFEDVETVDKKGKKTMQKKPIKKNIKFVKLLSGNIGPKSDIEDIADWLETEDPTDKKRAYKYLVSYRWPK